MDLFKTAQRIPPRRIPVVRRYLVLPAIAGPAIPLSVRRTPRAIAAVGGILGAALLTVGLYNLTEGESSGPVGPRSPRPSLAPIATPSFRTIPQAASDSGAGGGFSGPAAGPLVTEKATGNVISQLRRILGSLKKEPSTKANMTDRLAIFAKYFNSLTPSDRIALFGTIDFRQVEHAVRKQGDKAPQALDRCLAQLQLILF